MIDMTQAQAEWTSIADAQQAVRAALVQLAGAQYRHNLTRGCDALSAYRVVQRDLMDTVQPAIDAALMDVQAQVRS